MFFDDCGLPVGKPVPGWTRPQQPSREKISGTSCNLHPLTIDHAEDLWNAYAVETSHRNWVYLPYGPHDSLEDFQEWIKYVECFKIHNLFLAKIWFQVSGF